MNNGLLAEIAESQLGAHEDPKGSNKGTALLKYFQADNLEIGGETDGYAWCASFVDWCVQEWLRRQGMLPAREAWRPRTPVAFDLMDWGRENGCFLLSNQKLVPGTERWPRRGDIVVFDFSHTGIVTNVSPLDRHFTSVEGNTNDDGSREGWEVARRARTFAKVKRFIRLPLEL